MTPISENHEGSFSLPSGTLSAASIIAAAEAEAAALPALPALPDVAEDDLTGQERSEVEEAMELVYRSEHPAEQR